MTQTTRGTDALLETLYAGIIEAHATIRPAVAVTPLAYSERFSAATGCQVYLKCEHQQHTGSFKYRGAYNKLRLLSREDRARGVVAATSGNHGQAVALAARLAQVSATVYTSAGTSPYKLEAMRALGATVVTVPGESLEAELEAVRQAALQGRPYISPYNDMDVIAGQGTVGVEIHEQQPQVDAVFAAIGGGGLVSGIGTVLSRLNPNAQIIGCWPEQSAAMYHSLKAGHIYPVPQGDTLASGSAGNIYPGAITFDLCQRLLSRSVLVTEEEIRWAMKAVAVDEHWIIEGAAGVSLAGALKVARTMPGKRLVVVLCGRNVDWPVFLKAVS
ncbi:MULTISPECIES: threonine/serine dehydratase [Pseudomonas]|uniref:Threonine/serine dehydratase n=1 Tax=Pseudomonas quercus TaxID=2722792 RepID=A0ABX0Y8Q7_9PSED|nr:MULTISPECIES: threonine/serine dehydratase [Pseudomonas]MBF7141140.1 threonine/serine dehydratase [Pseudomonas sp. LY10J]NJO99674.1 threonine/serine dehydratase [Pseudomonas quercus]